MLRAGFVWLSSLSALREKSCIKNDCSFIGLGIGRGWRGCSFGKQCKIWLVNSGPNLIQPAAPPERNWLPLAIAAVVVTAVVAAIVLLGHGKSQNTATPLNAPLDPYANNLVISNLAMSQTSNGAGNNLMYVDGHIMNHGNKTVTGITVQVLFHGYTAKVAQNETQAMKFIRMRDPEVDVEPISAAPLKPGGAQDFRLIFDSVTQDWDGAYPEIRIVRVETQ